MKKYMTFEKIESEYPLAMLLNKAMHEMNLLRMSSAPRNFSPDRFIHCPLYYETCLWETYFHELYEDLIRMRNILIEYLYEFNADWLKYARFQRDRWIDEYDIEGKDEIMFFTALSMLKLEDEVSIVRDTKMKELETLFGVLKECSTQDIISEISKITGKTIKPYKMDSDGNTTPITEAERQFIEINKQLEAEDSVEKLKDVVAGVLGIYADLSKLPDEQNNEAALTAIFKRVNDLLELKIEKKCL